MFLALLSHLQFAHIWTFNVVIYLAHNMDSKDEVIVIEDSSEDSDDGRKSVCEKFIHVTSNDCTPALKPPGSHFLRVIRVRHGLQII